MYIDLIVFEDGGFVLLGVGVRRRRRRGVRSLRVTAALRALRAALLLLLLLRVLLLRLLGVFLLRFLLMLLMLQDLLLLLLLLLLNVDEGTRRRPCSRYQQTPTRWNLLLRLGILLSWQSSVVLFTYAQTGPHAIVMAYLAGEVRHLVVEELR